MIRNSEVEDGNRLRMNKWRKGDNLPKENGRHPYSIAEAGAHDQVDGSNLACVELFESVLASLRWASLKTPAPSVIERPFRAGVVDFIGKKY